MSDLENRLADIERRLAALEKHSHPPADLTRPIHRAIAAILREAAEVSEGRLTDG